MTKNISEKENKPSPVLNSSIRRAPTTHSFINFGGILFFILKPYTIVTDSIYARGMHGNGGDGQQI